jgi:hypothetical protein
MAEPRLDEFQPAEILAASSWHKDYAELLLKSNCFDLESRSV